MSIIKGNKQAVFEEACEGVERKGGGSSFAQEVQVREKEEGRKRGLWRLECSDHDNVGDDCGGGERDDDDDYYGDDDGDIDRDIESIEI